MDAKTSGLSDAQMSRIQEMMAERSNKTEDNRSKVPIVYTPDGTTKFRPYLDKNGEPMRTGFRHKIDKLSIPCNGFPQCKICSRLREISDGWDGAWVFNSREYVIFYAWIFECSDTQNKYVKLNEPVMFMGTGKLANEMSFQFKDTSIEDLKLLFDPSESTLIWQLRYDRPRKTLSLGYFNRKATMDPLPETFPALSDCYFKAGSVPSPDKETEFLLLIEEAYQRFLNIKPTDSASSEDRYKPDLSANSSSSSNSSNQADKVPPAPPVPPKAETSKVPRRVPANTPSETPPCFGTHSDGYDDSDCLMCKVESKCEDSSKK